MFANVITKISLSRLLSTGINTKKSQLFSFRSYLKYSLLSYIMGLSSPFVTNRTVEIMCIP